MLALTAHQAENIFRRVLIEATILGLRWKRNIPQSSKVKEAFFRHSQRSTLHALLFYLCHILHTHTHTHTHTHGEKIYAKTTFSNVSSFIKYDILSLQNLLPLLFSTLLKICSLGFKSFLFRLVAA